jgi:hypothetical protein
MTTKTKDDDTTADVPADETPEQAKARQFAEATAEGKERRDAERKERADARAAEQDKAAKATKDQPAEAPTPVPYEDDPAYRFTEAMPPPSDPSHPAHEVWAHEYALAPHPDEVVKIKEQQAKDAEAEEKARVKAAEDATAEQAKADKEQEKVAKDG